MIVDSKPPLEAPVPTSSVLLLLMAGLFKMCDIANSVTLPAPPARSENFKIAALPVLDLLLFKMVSAPQIKTALKIVKNASVLLNAFSALLPLIFTMDSVCQPLAAALVTTSTKSLSPAKHVMRPALTALTSLLDSATPAS